jgi:hypothetical protein
MTQIISSLPCGEQRERIREFQFAVKYWEIILENLTLDGIAAV